MASWYFHLAVVVVIVIATSSTSDGQCFSCAGVNVAKTNCKDDYSSPSGQPNCDSVTSTMCEKYGAFTIWCGSSNCFYTSTSCPVGKSATRPGGNSDTRPGGKLTTGTVGKGEMLHPLHLTLGLASVMTAVFIRY